MNENKNMMRAIAVAIAVGLSACASPDLPGNGPEAGPLPGTGTDTTSSAAGPVGNPQRVRAGGAHQGTVPDDQGADSAAITARPADPEPADDDAPRPLPVGPKPRLQDDFYTHVNYAYLTTTRLSPDKPEVNNMTALDDQARDTIKGILRNLHRNHASLPPGSAQRQIADFHAMALDFGTRDRLGMQPVQATLERIRQVKSMAGLNALMTELFLFNYTPLVSMGVSQDEKDSDTNILYVGPPELGLSRRMLLDRDDYPARVRRAHETFITELLVLAGETPPDAARKAARVLALERELASAMLTEEQAQDPGRTYHAMDMAQLGRLTRNLPHLAIMKRTGLDKARKIVVTQPKALKKASALASDRHLEALKAQMMFNVILRHAQHLSRDVLKAAARYQAVYSGVDHLDTDEELAYEATDSTFGRLLGKVYVEKTFSARTKADVVDLVEQIRDTYRRRIAALDGLSPATRARAQKKLDTLVIKIGYPDKWEDYPGLVIRPHAEGGNLVQAAQAVEAIEFRRNLDKLNRKPDRGEWALTPQTVNAYYNPLNNEIVFPAAILRPPFYSPQASRAENLGGIGTVIGHEMSHAFDISGAQFDEKGNLEDWWTEQDLRRFQKKAKQAAAIYSKIEVLPGHFINGELSTGEIMADLGGLTVALDIARQEGVSTRDVFTRYAKVWRTVGTRELLISGLTDEHPPGKYRINNIVNLMDDFYTDFDVKPSDRMYVAPKDRLTVW